MHAVCVHVTFGVGINPEFAIHRKLVGVAAKICNALTVTPSTHPGLAACLHGSSQKWRNSIRILGENCLNRRGIDLGRLQDNF